MVELLVFDLVLSPSPDFFDPDFVVLEENLLHSCVILRKFVSLVDLSSQKLLSGIPHKSLFKLRELFSLKVLQKILILALKIL